jgi:hypothetical protein
MRVVVYLGPDHDLYHTSRLFTGLTALHQRGDISLRYEVPHGEERWLVGDPIVVCLDLGAATPRRCAIDLRDGLGMSWPIIERVDRYFKRAFHRPELTALAPALAQKVEPFGLNYGCRSTASAVQVVRKIGFPLLRRGFSGVQRLRQYWSTPAPAAFEQGPDAPVEGKVMFQTRLWTAEEIPPDEVQPLNESRVAMVRGLKKAFGTRFVGGLVPTRLALEHYPDDVTPHPSRYIEYLTLKKRCLVSVYTRGVEHSLAFKLGETLAASQCLVSVPLRYELPSPLVAWRNYLPFDTPAEAVAACDRLLTDYQLARAMRHANHEYYVGEVAPAAHLARVLARATQA